MDMVVILIGLSVHLLQNVGILNVVGQGIDQEMMLAIWYLINVSLAPGAWVFFVWLFDVI